MVDLTFDIIVFRVLLAFFLSGIIGFEREMHKQAAGLRTHILICVGAALLMILSIYVPANYAFGNGVGDPARIAAQVVSGIGFLGAGAILRYGFNVKGITTAANIWVMAALGLMVGAGLYLPAVFAAGIILFTLIGVDQIEKKVIVPSFMKSLEIKYSKKKTNFNEIKKIISEFGKIKGVEISKKVNDEIKCKFILQLKLGMIEKLIHSLDSKIHSFKLSEKFD